MSTALFVMPRTPATWAGAAALWITVAGWGEAERRRGGAAKVLTPEGVVEIEDCLEATGVASPSTSARTHRIPQWARQLARDCQRATAMQRYRARAVGRVTGADAAPTGFIWQHHELFHDVGATLRREFDVPVLEYVHAPIVWEARRWGVRRPGSGWMLEALGERPQLRKADLVACVSDEVGQELLRFGVPEERLVVAPMGVNAERFTPRVDGSDWRRRNRDLGEFVLGWAGSLRRFHHLDIALDAVRDLRARGVSVGLSIAGDGQDRRRLESLVAEHNLGNWVRFNGQIAASEMPSFLAGVDAAVVTAGAGQEFHYSPLKLREYLAMQLPVLAPALGEIERVVTDGATAILYEPGSSIALAEAAERLLGDQRLRAHLGAAGRERVLQAWTWDAISTRCIDALRSGGR